MLGAAIGRFRIQARLGSGGFGEVWLAAHEEPPHNQVAIKLFRPEVSAHAAMGLAFDEARTLSRLAVASIAKIYDANHLTNGQAYLIQDYIPGESLMQRIAYGRHSSTQLADIIEQTANALVSAATAGVFHNNLKPSNILIVKDPDRASGERVVVVDFAHAKLISAFPDKGAAGYMAPEVQPGIKGDWRIDAYSLGCIAFELGCQRTVFIADSWDKLRAKHVKDQAPNLRSFVPDASAALDRLVARMLEKNPLERPKSMKDISKLFQLMVGYEAPLGETVKD
jgi:eukaryotic-like serine/threonine-protein kinase